MSDIISIIVKEEWSTWIEKLLDKARRSGIKDILLGKVTIPKTNEKTDEVNSQLKISNLNKLTYTELILSIDLRTSIGKVALSIVKGFKDKYYTGGNAAMAWETLRNK
jgi:hypothetical protein